MVNSLCPFGNGHLLPRGTLRELPKQALRRADALVLHNVDLLGTPAAASACCFVCAVGAWLCVLLWWLCLWLCCLDGLLAPAAAGVALLPHVLALHSVDRLGAWVWLHLLPVPAVAVSLSCRVVVGLSVGG